MVSNRIDTARSHSLRTLRDAPGVDQTFQNLLRALTLNLELRSRLRVFEFEASQDGHAETAELFRRLRYIERQQIGLHKSNEGTVWRFISDK